MDITGKYLSIIGEIQFRQVGARVIGIYGSSGLIEGTLNENILNAKWRCAGGNEGLMEFTFSENGNFKLKYKSGFEEGTMKHGYSGQKIPEKINNDVPQAPDPSESNS